MEKGRLGGLWGSVSSAAGTTTLPQSHPKLLTNVSTSQPTLFLTPHIVSDSTFISMSRAT